MKVKVPYFKGKTVNGLYVEGFLIMYGKRLFLSSDDSVMKRIFTCGDYEESFALKENPFPVSEINHEHIAMIDEAKDLELIEYREIEI